MSDIAFRRATRADLPAIIALLADDELGRSREDVSFPPNKRYVGAFEAIDADPNQLLALMVSPEGVIGCLQLTFIPGLSRQGMWRGQIESVRIHSSRRGEGLGRTMFEWAIAECRSRGCGLVQLTTDKTRADARRFYASLGFIPTHEGMKLTL